MKKMFLIASLLSCCHLCAAEKPQVGEIVWNELIVTNVQGAKDFYSKVFGWEFTDKNMGDMVYTIIKKGNHEFGGMAAIPADKKDQVPPHWLAYVLVENVEQSLEKARANGATTIVPIQKAGDMGLFAIIRDPVGAHIALWQNLKKY